MGRWKVEGAHLTAADRRNVKALLAHADFKPGVTFDVGRKRYSVTPDTAARFRVVTTEFERDDFGRRVKRSYESYVTTV